MNYELLFPERGDSKIRLALTGPNGAFGRSLLVQCRAIPQMKISALCDLDIDGTGALLGSLGFGWDTLATCYNREQVRSAVTKGKIVITRDYRHLSELALDIVVETTGQPEASVQIAIDAMRRGVHVAMVSKETDSVVGSQLSQLARECGVVYTATDGDQPSNLIDLVTWARILGFEIIAAGKSSEYDYAYDQATGKLHYIDSIFAAPALNELWHLTADVALQLRERRAAFDDLPPCATPDYCEMNVVANSTGLAPAGDELSYPLCRITELADVFIPEQDGGILQRTGVLDVFHCLRRTDEPSFGGGVFIVVRCTDAHTWELLRQKGHVVSRSGKYACIYRPYHLMGLEAPLSLFSAVVHHRPSGSTAAVHAVMVARTEREFSAGETLCMGGHHHSIDGAVPLLLPATAENLGKAPFYLAANKRLLVDVLRGTVITSDMLDLKGSSLFAVWGTREPAEQLPRL
jgi:predicted homoserine dehydrogenase-like protein